MRFRHIIGTAQRPVSHVALEGPGELIFEEARQKINSMYDKKRGGNTAQQSTLWRRYLNPKDLELAPYLNRFSYEMNEIIDLVMEIEDELLDVIMDVQKLTKGRFLSQFIQAYELRF